MSIVPKDFLFRLVQRGILTQDQADRLEIESINKNVPIDRYLLQYSNLAKDEVYKTKAELLNVPFVNISQTAVDPQSLSYISQQLASKYKIIPYLFDGKSNTLYIATFDPLNVTLQDFLEMKTGLKITLALASEEDINQAITVAYAKNLSPEVEQALKQVEPIQKPINQKVVTENIAISDAPIAKIVNTILEFAGKSRASDVHIEPQELKTRVRYRIDGILQEKLSLPSSIHESLVSRVKILSELKIDEKRIPQDGRFNFKLDDEEIDLRVSTLPTVHGEKIVMRLLRKSGGLPSLEELGLKGVQLKRLEDGLSRPYGIVLITGPTGSGKTTTLYSILSRLNTNGVNIVTIEDPVEYQIDGINQVQINNQAGLTFAAGLKSFLRQDPNIILVGEIRDKETTQLAIQAALTGHLVFSTLHTNDSATAIPRLIDLGGEPFLIASVLSSVVAQRIVRRVCDNCKEWYEPSGEVQQLIRNILGNNLPKQYMDGAPMKLSRGRKCEDCNQSGYKGRVGIYEIFKLSPAINELILKQTSSNEIADQACKEGMLLMKQDGFLKALEGITTLEEVLRVAENV
jgi:type IV pilus assembly protein PilB